MPIMAHHADDGLRVVVADNEAWDPANTVRQRWLIPQAVLTSITPEAGGTLTRVNAPVQESYRNTSEVEGRVRSPIVVTSATYRPEALIAVSRRAPPVGSTATGTDRGQAGSRRTRRPPEGRPSKPAARRSS